jgi:hypothetical protein
VLDHSNHRKHYVISHCKVIEDEGCENGDEDECDDSDDEEEKEEDE